MIVGLSVLVAVAFGPSSASGSAPACARHAAGPRLPAVLRVITMCATYTVSRDGRVRASTTPRHIGEEISWFQVAGNGAPVVQRGPGIAVLMHGKTVWRSRGDFKANAVFALTGPGVVAFGYLGRFANDQQTALYVAPFGGTEHRIATDAYPLGWTQDGNLLTWGRGIQLRSPSGRLLRRVLAHSREFRFDQQTRTLLAISHGNVLESYRSGHWSTIANLTRLGLDRHTSFEQLPGGLIGLLDRERVTILRQNGSPFASARFHSGQPASKFGDGFSGLVANAAGTAVAFVVTQGTPAQGHGRQMVELLRAGDSHATLLHAGNVPLGCGAWTTLAWHNQWLIDSAVGGQTLVLDTTRRSRLPLDLTPLVHRLSPNSNPLRIAWA